MPKFSLYHLRPEFAREAYGAADGVTPKRYVDAQRFIHVALIEASVLGEVFQVTNHGVPGQADDWTTLPSTLTLWNGNRVRSTSVGDLIEDESGQAWLVAGCGFDKVEVF